MNVLLFAAVPPDPDDAARDRLDHLKGLFRRDRFAALMIAVAMLSLAGIPPFPGFIAKFLIFKNVMAAGHTLYAVLGLVGSYLGIYFYLRVIQFLFMSDEDRPTDRARTRAPRAGSELHLPRGVDPAGGISGLGHRVTLASSLSRRQRRLPCYRLRQPPAIVAAVFPGVVSENTWALHGGSSR
jgi:NADH:ubiquinone oxidoreductase subunit 5 (subunit L)/multisubunit Na+/H+ antiporter MnhA subunit